MRAFFGSKYSPIAGYRRVNKLSGHNPQYKYNVAISSQFAPYYDLALYHTVAADSTLAEILLGQAFVLRKDVLRTMRS